MVLDCMEGYQVREISKRRAEKEYFGNGLEGIVAKEKLREEVLKALRGKGRVFDLYSKKEKKTVACYIFEKQQVKSSEVPYQKIQLTKDNLWEFIKTGRVEEAKVSGEDNNSEEYNNAEANYSEKSYSEKMETGQEEDKDILVYSLTGQYNIGLPEDTIKIFEKCILAELKEDVIANQMDSAFLGTDTPEAIIWNNATLRPSKVKVGSFGYINALPLGLGTGVALGVALDNIALGICFGFLWAMIFGMAFTKSGTGKGDEQDATL